MVVGNGMLANAFCSFKDNENILIFASGVSSSLETNPTSFKREMELVKNSIKLNSGKLLVYFSTCSLYDPLARSSRYVEHKLEIEDFIKNHCKKYLIFRVSQILGKGNKTTLVNFLFNNILNSIHFDLWKNVTRNLIALEDVVTVGKFIINDPAKHNNIYHLANSRFISMLELVRLIESITGTAANYTELNLGQQYLPIPDDINKFTSQLNINFGNDYYLTKLTDFYRQIKC
jgi:hypothetical protein